MCHFWTSRLTSCRNLASCPLPLFLNDPIVVLPHLPMLAEPKRLKNLARTHTKPMSQHIVGKTCLESTRVDSKHQKATPIEFHMGALAADFSGYFSLGAPMRGHPGAKISKTCSWQAKVPNLFEICAPRTHNVAQIHSKIEEEEEERRQTGNSGSRLSIATPHLLIAVAERGCAVSWRENET